MVEDRALLGPKTTRLYFLTFRNLLLLLLLLLLLWLMLLLLLLFLFLMLVVAAVADVAVADLKTYFTKF